MRLVVVSGAYPPMRAGEADHVFHICENLARRGVEVHVVTTRQRDIDQGFGFAVYPVIKDWSWRDLWRLRRQIRRISPEVVLLYYIGWIYNYHPMITFMPTIVKRWDARVRFVTEFANTEGAELERFSAGTRALRKAMVSWAAPAGVDYAFGTLLRDSDALIVLSGNHGDMLADRFKPAKQKTNLIPPAPLIKMSQGDVAAARKRGRQVLRVTAEEFVFAYFGYVYPGKGVDTLMQAFHRVSQRYSHARLLILGGTIAKEFLERPGYANEMSAMPKHLNIENKVIWYGEFDWNSDEASICLTAVDACVIPVDGGVQLNNSSFAAVVAHGLPVVATRGRVLEDAFQDEKNVLLCPPKDPQLMADAMEKVISDPDLARRLKKGALEMAEEWFSWKKAVDRTLRVLESPADRMTLPQGKLGFDTNR